MEQIPIYASVVTAILGVAYPIILQVITKLDDTYSSTLIVELFQKEAVKKWFERLLFISLIAIVIWSFKFEPIGIFKNRSFFIDDSASLLVIISTSALVYYFYQFVQKMLEYSIPAKFVKYLFKKHNETRNDAELKYFKALTDVFLNSIKRTNYDLVDTIVDELNELFRSERETSKVEEVVYPEAFYLLVSKTVETLATITSKRFGNLKSFAAGSNWLLGYLTDKKPAAKTYTAIWGNLRLMLLYNRSDLVLYHWQWANFYISRNLEGIESDKQNEQRERFLEFHYALGGLLLNQKKYDVLKQIFEYTSSVPPRYHLLPSSTTDIFQEYYNFYPRINQRNEILDITYPFPTLIGANTEHIIKKEIQSYITLLFIRHFILENANPMNPSYPKSQTEIIGWINMIDEFEELLEENLNNKTLMESLNYFDSPQSNKLIYNSIIEFINNIKTSLEANYEDNAQKTEIKDKNKEQLYTRIKESFLYVQNKIKKFSNEQTKSNNNEVWDFSPIKQLIHKNILGELDDNMINEVISITAKPIINNIKKELANSFDEKRSNSYTLKRDEVQNAIRTLIQKENRYVIVAMGYNKQSLKGALNISTSENFGQGNVEILFLDKKKEKPPSLFILEKENLPWITSLRVSDDELSKYALKKINEDWSIYASIIDMNKAPNDYVFEKYSQIAPEELRKYALVSVFLNLEIAWKKEMKMVQIVPYSEYYQMRLPNELDEIQPL